MRSKVLQVLVLILVRFWNVEILNYFDPEVQFKDTESKIKNKLKKSLTELRGFKIVTTLVLAFQKIESDSKTKYDSFYSISKAEIIVNEKDIDVLLKSIYTAVILNMQKSLGKVPGWINDLVIDHNISISKYNSLAGSSYIELPKELNYPRK